MKQCLVLIIALFGAGMYIRLFKYIFMFIIVELLWKEKSLLGSLINWIESIEMKIIKMINKKVMMHLKQASVVIQCKK